MSKDKKPDWTYHSHYRGVVIEHRPGMQKRGFCSIYHNGYAGWTMGIFTHHSLENAHKHIDKLCKDLGERVQVTMEEYKKFAAAGYKEAKPQKEDHDQIDE